jgi:deoxyribonuclease V
LVLAACQRLQTIPDLILVDGQGLAHPRRMGLASHLGLLLDIPAIGCAKSLLCGRHEPPGAGAGCYSELIHGGEVIGAALRTKEGTKPIYVSIGHKVDLPTAIYWVMQCCRGHKIPEPTRLAHLAAGGRLEESFTAKGQQGGLLV